MVLESLERREVFAGVAFDSLTALGNGVDSTFANAVDSDQVGNAYVTGLFRGTVDFDPSSIRADGSDTLTARGSGDTYVAKYAVSGSLVWVVQFGSDNNAGSGSNIKVDPAGNVYFNGGFTNAISVGSETLISMGLRDQFVAKLTSDGVVQWARRMGGTSDDNFVGLDVDSSGNLLAATVVDQGSLTIQKWGATGSAIWSKTVATQSTSINGDLVVDGAGNVYVSGNFNRTVDFDPSNKVRNITSFSTTYGTGFVMSLNSQGNFRWVSPFQANVSASGFIGSAQPNALAIDKVGNVIVSGSRGGRIDFQASSATYFFPSEWGGFLTSLNPTTGFLNWAKSFDTGSTPGSGSIYVDDIDTDSLGNVYLAGAFTGTVDFDPSSAINSKSPVVPSSLAFTSDAYYMKLSGTGEFLWVETIGGVGGEWSRGISVDGTGGIHVVGSVNANTAVDFNSDPLITNEISTTGTKYKGFRLRVRQV